MVRRFTREELYALVWERPRTALAKELGVSDVWIGKQCREAHIPMPAAGYWAMAQSGRYRRKPLLPVRLPGHPSQIVIGERHEVSRWGDPENLDDPITAPVIVEDIPAQVAAALVLIGKISAKRDLSQPHSRLSRILAREAQRRAKLAANGVWSLDTPHFDDVTHQRQLRILNSLSWALDRVSRGGEVFDESKWVQGLGTVYRLCLRLDFGGTSLDLRFLEPSSNRQVIGETPPDTTTLRVGDGEGGLPAEQWCDSKGNRLEQQLPEIVAALLRRAELSYRSSLERQHEWLLERRQDRLRELDRQRAEAERVRLAEIEARKKKLREEITTLARDARTAQEIRAMVADLDHHPDLNHQRPTSYDAWREEALRLADHLDPMKRPLDELLGKLN